MKLLGTRFIAIRHIAGTAVVGILAALLMLVALVAFMALISELSDIGKGSYGVADMLWYVVLTLPRRAHDLFPAAAVVGALGAVGGLAASSELVAYRAAGLSRLRIGVAVVIGAALVLLPMLMIGEWLAPKGELAAQSMRIRLMTDGSGLAGGRGLWVRDGNAIVHAWRPIAGDAPGDVSLAEVEIFRFGSDDAQWGLDAAIRAGLAEHDGSIWQLKDVRESRFTDSVDGIERVEVIEHESMPWGSLMDPAVLQTAVARPKYLGVTDLLPYIRYLRDNELDTQAYDTALWWRIAYPFSVLAVVLAGMPFVFGSWRAGGMGQRLFIGMVLGAGFYMVNKTVGSLAQVYGFSAAAAAFVPSALLVTLAVVLLRRGS